MESAGVEKQGTSRLRASEYRDAAQDAPRARTDSSIFSQPHFTAIMLGRDDSMAHVGRKITDAEWKKIKEIAADWERRNPIPEPPARTTPMIFGYRRVSSDRQVKSGIGLDIQEKTLAAYIAFLQASHPELVVGEMLVDEAESAYQGKHHKLLDRPEGQKLRVLAQAGDHVVFAKLDRAFCRTRDALDTVGYFSDKGVHVHFVDPHIDATTKEGEMILTVVAMLAQMESRTRSERMKEIAAHLRAEGRPVAGMAPFGWKVVGTIGHKRYVPDLAARSIMGEIVRLRDERNLPFTRVADLLETGLAAKEHRKYEPEWKRRFKAGKVSVLYRREKAIRAESEMVRAKRKAE